MVMARARVPPIIRHLKADTDGPYMLRQQGTLLADDAPLVPGGVFRPQGGQKIDGHGDTSHPQAHPDFG